MFNLFFGCDILNLIKKIGDCVGRGEVNFDFEFFDEERMSVC